MTSETGTSLATTINTSSISVLQQVTILSINATQSFINTVYSVETQDSNGLIQIVTISVEPDQQPVIVQVEEVTAVSSTS